MSISTAPSCSAGSAGHTHRHGGWHSRAGHRVGQASTLVHRLRQTDVGLHHHQTTDLWQVRDLRVNTDLHTVDTLNCLLLCADLWLRQLPRKGWSPSRSCRWLWSISSSLHSLLCWWRVKTPQRGCWPTPQGTQNMAAAQVPDKTSITYSTITKPDVVRVKPLYRGLNHIKDKR